MDQQLAARVCGYIGMERIIAYFDDQVLPNDPVAAVEAMRELPYIPQELTPLLHGGEYARWLREVHECILLLGRNGDGPIVYDGGHDEVDEHNNAIVIGVDGEVARDYGFDDEDLRRLHNFLRNEAIREAQGDHVADQDNEAEDDYVELRVVISMTIDGRYCRVVAYQSDHTDVVDGPDFLEADQVDEEVGALVAQGFNCVSMIYPIENA